MSIVTKLGVGADLSKRMSQAVGADLEHAFDGTSDVGALALRGVALRCAACSDMEACAKLLAENETLESPPDFCRNKALLERLQRT